MPTPITAKHGVTTLMTITLASLATSVAGVGRQSTLINNSDAGQMVRVYFKVTTGTTPTVNKVIQFYLLTADTTSSPNISTDAAGSTDAALTVATAQIVNIVQVTATSNVTYQGSFLLRNPGVAWGIAIVHDTGVNLNATAGNHSMYYVTENQTF